MSDDKSRRHYYERKKKEVKCNSPCRGFIFADAGRCCNKAIEMRDCGEREREREMLIRGHVSGLAKALRCYYSPPSLSRRASRYYNNKSCWKEFNLVFLPAGRALACVPFIDLLSCGLLRAKTANTSQPCVTELFLSPALRILPRRSRVNFILWIVTSLLRFHYYYYYVYILSHANFSIFFFFYCLFKGKIHEIVENRKFMRSAQNNCCRWLFFFCFLPIRKYADDLQTYCDAPSSLAKRAKRLVRGINNDLCIIFTQNSVFFWQVYLFITFDPHKFKF